MLMELAWNLVGFEGSHTLSKELLSKVKQLAEILHLLKSRQGNVMKELKLLRQKLLEYTKQLYSKKRTVAFHLMIFMIVDESRNMIRNTLFLYVFYLMLPSRMVN